MSAPPPPKLIHSLWLQGRANAPDLVQVNFARWAALNPDYQLNVLDGAAAVALLADAGLPLAHLTPQALSDLVRTRLLLDRGGLWIDATVFPVRPLDEWLPQAVEPVGFFAFDRPGPDRPLASWLLAASPDHPILRQWWREALRFWSKPRRLLEGIPSRPSDAVSPLGAATDLYPYYWFHYLFQYMVETQAEVAALWARCPKHSADAPHALQRLFAADARPAQAEIAAALFAAPVQKLNWRAPYPVYLLEQISRAALPV